MGLTNRRNIFWTLLAVIAVAAALTGGVDRLGADSAADAFKRALVTFAVSRALNGAISVAQGTELAIEPAGVGVILSLGQVLDPINDLVERFSTVMLVAASSLGLQNVLLRITSSPGFDIFLGITAFLVLVTTWAPLHWLQNWSKLARQILLFVIFIRFAIPLLLIGTSLVFDNYLEAEQAAAVSALEGVQLQIEEMNEEPPTVPSPDESLVDRFSKMLDEAAEAMNVSDRIDQLQTQVSKASEHIINLIVIFVLQTILLPVAFVWLFIEILKSAARRLTGQT
ncbi:MAG: hypothetical protein QF790_02905 [Gammaproteobacteria bacterium]|jgi:hypothetical protein|nr:hypothetical protein [Gammaproteobacteria bacterium]MDP6616097.1 hypothetical protein [Gammaproteobacteria bacterium]MDP6696063.1 hypothetical protein [Gammaproteobacteria bacterium]MDP7042047.1 hypothetical protein [Gammaproteobacteria bacterium]